MTLLLQHERKRSNRRIITPISAEKTPSKFLNHLYSFASVSYENIQTDSLLALIVQSIELQPFQSIDSAYHRIYEQIHSFTDRKNLPDFIALTPNQHTILDATKVLDAFNSYGIVPGAVNPSPEGGVMFEHIINEHYFMFELYNDGIIAYLHRLPDGTLYDEELSLSQVESKIVQDIQRLT